VLGRRLAVQNPPVAARFVASIWGATAARYVERPLDLPARSCVIGIGAPLLGGSCKTPFAIALAISMAKRGARVALVGHAYGAKPAVAKIVSPHDDVAIVGDDALFAARELAGHAVPVVVAKSRADAVHFAAERADIVIVDGLLQTRPARLFRSMLLLDGKRPWGNGCCPPAGDLRAPHDALLSATDRVVIIDDARDDGVHPENAANDVERTFASSGGALIDEMAAFEKARLPEIPTPRARVTSHLDSVSLRVGAGALAATHPPSTPIAAVHRTPAPFSFVLPESDRLDDPASIASVPPFGSTATLASGRSARIRLESLRGHTLGLVLTIARPDRILETLARRGIEPALIASFPDHHRPSATELTRLAARSTQRIELWLTTGKCATKLPACIAEVPVAVLEHRLELPLSLVNWALSA
jgi:tetraacyldisaccharide-1-P 4'-kinase